MSKRKNEGVVIAEVNSGPGCLVQLIWFLFLGWWLGQFWAVIAYLLVLTIIGIPLGVIMFNKLPQVIALRSPKTQITATEVGGATFVTVDNNKPQRNLLIRIIYFFAIGWWLTAFWVELAYIAAITILGLPLAFWMFDKTPAVLSLRRN